MPARPGRGRLLPPAAAPPTGERVDAVARIGSVTVEQILSGALDAPVEFDQDHDEWVVVLRGHAVVDVDGERLELGDGDWLLLPAHTPHRLVATRPGTTWLALHAET